MVWEIREQYWNDGQDIYMDQNFSGMVREPGGNPIKEI